MDPRTADLVDAHGAALRVCDAQFRIYSKRQSYSGPVRTLQVFEDNALVKETLSTAGDGAVLVVDGAASPRCALVGDVLAGLGATNGWSGLVVWGAVRDAVALREMGLGIKALGTNPARAGKTGAGQLDIPIRFGGVIFRPGDWLYSDADGIVLSDQRL